MQSASFSTFGYDFQTKIFKCIVEDKQYGASMIQMVKPTYFTQDKFQTLLKKIKNYYAQYQSIPNYTTIKILIGGIDNKQQIPTLLDLLNKIQQDITADEINFVKKQSLNFCKNAQMKSAIIDSVDLLNQNNMDGIWDRMNKVMKVTLDGDIGLDMNHNFDYVTLKSNRKAISTGYQLLDKQFDGGIGKGELAVVMAPTGGGKSQFLVNIAKGALMQGKVVVYVSLELSQKQIAARAGALLSSHKINSLQEKKDQVIAAIKHFYSKTNSKLIIKQYPTKSIGISTVRAYLNKLKATGIIPNMLIIDYIDLLKPGRSSKEKRNELEQLYESVRQLAGTQNIPIWSATQTNRSGIEAQIIGVGAVSESFGKMFVCDQVLSISRTTDDKIAGTGKLHIIKNRSGQQGQTFSMLIDTSRSLFLIERKLSQEECGTDTNNILKDFKAERDTKIQGRMASELSNFLNKPKQKKEVK